MKEDYFFCGESLGIEIINCFNKCTLKTQTLIIYSQHLTQNFLSWADQSQFSNAYNRDLDLRQAFRVAFIKL
jgi:hypothetical protein